APVPTAGANTTNNTNSFNNVSPSATTVSPNFGIAEKSSFVDPSNYPDDPNMPEEGIDYDEVFASVGKIEAILLFLAYASFIGFEDPDYPDKVYKVVKALYELHQAPRAWYETLANYLLENGFQRGNIDQTLFIKQQKGDILLVQENSLFLGLQEKQKDDGIFISQDKYVAKILRKFSFTDVKSASTPIETEKPLLKDPDGEDVDVHIYMSMIGSLMYLTSSRPGKPHLGLWYPKDSLFNLVAYSDSDYARASLDRKSTTRGCQFLEQTVSGKDKSNSLMADNLPKIVCNEALAIPGQTATDKVCVVRLKLVLLVLIEAQHHIYNESPLLEVNTPRCDEIVDFLNGHVIQYALLVNPTIYVACIKQFWASATIKKANDVVKLRSLNDGKRVIVTEDVIRQVLSFDDGDGWNVYRMKRFLLNKITQALEILKLKRRVKKLEKKRRSKSSGLKRLRKGRKNDDNAADKEVNAAEPTVFNDEEVTMTMDQTLIKIKAEKVRLLDEQMAKRLHDEEIEQAVATEKQDMDDLEKAKMLQKQYVDKQENIDWNVVVEQMQEKHLDNIRKYQSLKRKQISIAQARKNMVVYLKNMAGYKMEYFKDEEPIKKRVAEETLLQESFKKLKAVKVSGSYSTQDTSTNDPKEMSEEDVNNMLEIVLVTKFKVEALQIELKRLFEPNADDVIWKLQRYMNYPIMWKLHSNYGVHQVSSTTRRHDMYMLIKKDYPLSNEVITLMLSLRLQVEEDSEMARDLVMKIFMKANQPKSRSLDTSSNVSAIGSRLMLSGKNDFAAEELKKLL
nr:hypothetical protein [Tanacetum cinerariifolium]